jgi:lysophospholipase L1-like esterase
MSAIADFARQELATILGLFLLGVTMAGGLAAAQEEARTASFAAFNRRAQDGERLNVVFFGASLTWGANASDPMLTSYRANVANYLAERYPKAHFRFWDAAIGGTGSQLGVFRVERDVLNRKPDLVFLDFSANDDINSADPETMASYEAVVRRLLQDGRCPVLIVMFPFKWDITRGNTEGMLGRDGHLEIARAYNTPVGDAVARAQQLVAEGKVTPDAIFNIDSVHPGDLGYRLFADAATAAFDQAVATGAVCRVPDDMLHANTYMTQRRVRISTLPRLPDGWHIEPASRVAAWFDGLPSRWLDDVVVARKRSAAPEEAGQPAKPKAPASLVVKVKASMVMLFGEETLKSGRYRVYIDGDLVVRRVGKEARRVFEFEASARRFGGNRQHAQVVVTGMDPHTEHTLEIEPVLENEGEEELRLESICVAGGEARAWM